MAVGPIMVQVENSLFVAAGGTFEPNPTVVRNENLDGTPPNVAVVVRELTAQQSYAVGITHLTGGAVLHVAPAFAQVVFRNPEPNEPDTVLNAPSHVDSPRLQGGGGVGFVNFQLIVTAPALSVLGAARLVSARRIAAHVYLDEEPGPP